MSWKKTFHWIYFTPAHGLAMALLMLFQVSPTLTLANPFDQSIELLKSCREKEGITVNTECLEVSACQTDAQMQAQSLQKNNEQVSGYEAAVDQQAMMNNVQPCLEAANATCQQAASGCQKECARVKQQVQSDLSRCQAQFPTSAANCTNTAQQILDQASGKQTSCQKEGFSFNADTMAALAVLGATGAAALLNAKKRKSSKSSAVSCDFYNPATGILKGYEDKYTPPAHATAKPVETERSGDETENGSMTQLKKQAGAEIPKSPEGRPLFHPDCLTAEAKVPENEKAPKVACENDIDCLCSSPKTEKDQEVCGCYDSTTKTAVVSPVCSTILSANPTLIESINKNRQELDAKKPKAPAQDTEFVFSEEEQLEQANKLQQTAGSSAGQSSGGSLEGGQASLPGSLPEDSEGPEDQKTDNSDLATNSTGGSGTATGGGSFSFSSRAGGSQGPSDLARSGSVGGSRSVSSVAQTRKQNGINPAHGKGVFELISEAYKKRAREMKR